MFAEVFPSVIEGIYGILDSLLSWKGEMILNLLMACWKPKAGCDVCV